MNFPRCFGLIQSPLQAALDHWITGSLDRFPRKLQSSLLFRNMKKHGEPEELRFFWKWLCFELLLLLVAAKSSPEVPCVRDKQPPRLPGGLEAPPGQ